MKHNLQSRLACQPIYLLVNEIASTIIQITLYPVNLTGNGCRLVWPWPRPTCHIMKK